MLVMMVIFWLVTVGCFLLYVRHLRKQSAAQTIKLETVSYEPLAFKQGVPDSTIANSEQPVEPSLPKIPKGWKKADGKTRHVKTGLVDIMWGDGAIDLKQQAKAYRDAWIKSDCKVLDIIAYRVCKPSEKRHTISDKKVSESAKKSSKNKEFSAKAANKPKQRKTVTVKKRVTK
jgi:hypothetical protein